MQTLLKRFKQIVLAVGAVALATYSYEKGVYDGYHHRVTPFR